MKNVRIPRYESGNSTHARLRDLAMEAEKVVKSNQGREITPVEREVDVLAAEVFGLSSSELKEAIESLRFLEK